MAEASSPRRMSARGTSESTVAAKEAAKRALARFLNTTSKYEANTFEELPSEVGVFAS